MHTRIHTIQHNQLDQFGNFHLRLTVIGLLTICFPSVQRKSPNSYFLRVAALLACTMTLNVFLSPIFVKVKEGGTTAMLYPFGERVLTVYVLGGPTFVTVRAMVTGFKRRFGNVIEG